MPPGWDAIPGARGCTPEACGFRDAHAQFTELGARVARPQHAGLRYQREMSERVHLPFPVLSDERLELTSALGLPTFEAGGSTLLKRLTLVIDDGRIGHVFYPCSRRTPTPGRCSLAARLSGSLADSEQSVFWLDSPDAPEPLPPLEGEARCDLAIVGGGFTGLWAALLAAPDEDVVLLEGDRCGGARAAATAASSRRR